MRVRVPRASWLPFLILCSFIPPAGAHRQDRRELYEQALARFRANDHQGALEDFSRLFEQTGQADLRYYVGVCQMNLGHYSEARAAFEDALAARPDSPEVRLGLARSLFQMDRASEAHREFARVLEAQPDNVEALYHLGLLASAEEDYSTALKHFEEATRLDPFHLGSLYNAGQVSMRLEKTDEAREYLSRHQQLREKFDRINVLEMAAGYSSATARNWLSLANAYLDVNQRSRAAEAFEKALQMEPSLTDVRFYLGLLYFELERWEKSVHNFRAFLEKNPRHFDALFNLAQSYRGGDDWKKAVETYRAAARANPTSPLPLDAVTEVHIEREAWDEALQAASSLTDRFPGHAQGFFLKAFCLMQLKQLETALGAAERAVELEPGQSSYQSLLDQIRQQAGESPQDPG